MTVRLTAAVLALAAFASASAAEAAYRLCVRAGSYDRGGNSMVTLTVGDTPFVAPNGAYGQIDTCFDDTAAHGAATVNWSNNRVVGCSGAPVPQGHGTEVWFLVSTARADPGLGGIIPTCQRLQ